ncbi:MAG: DUF4105 domain-containing protein [Nanoarchaeota archaeon]
MLNETNELGRNPEFYNTLTSTCTTNLAESVSKNTNVSISKYHFKVLLPGFSDKLLLDKNLIDTNLTEINEVREAFKINEKARKYQYLANFSQGIRK